MDLNPFHHHTPRRHVLYCCLNLGFLARQHAATPL
jgi:hypothetical protein